MQQIVGCVQKFTPNKQSEGFWGSTKELEQDGETKTIPFVSYPTIFLGQISGSLRSVANKNSQESFVLHKTLAEPPLSTMFDT